MITDPAPETAIAAALLAAPAVTAIVGTRIYPEFVPAEEPLPSLAFEKQGTEYETTVHGTVVAKQALLSITCMAETRPGAEVLADAVEAALVAADFIPQERSQGNLEEVGIYFSSLTFGYWQL